MEWRPQPLILAAGCDLEASIMLELERDAAAFTREIVVLGRHGERPGLYRSSQRCELDGRPLLHEAVRIDGGDVASSSAAVLAGARAFASLALLGVAPKTAADPDELALAGDGRVLRALAADTASLQARVEPAERAYCTSSLARRSRERARRIESLHRSSASELAQERRGDSHPGRGRNPKPVRRAKVAKPPRP